MLPLELVRKTVNFVGSVPKPAPEMFMTPFMTGDHELGEMLLICRASLMSRYVKATLAVKLLKLLEMVVLPITLQLGMVIFAWMLVNDFIVQILPHKLKTMSLEELGKPLPTTVTYTPPFESPDELVTLVRTKFAVIAVTSGP